MKCSHSMNTIHTSHTVFDLQILLKPSDVPMQYPMAFGKTLISHFCMYI